VGENGLSVLDVLTRDPGTAQDKTLEGVWQSYQRERGSGASPFAAAVLVASQVDRLGFAFAVGYPAALEELVEGVRLPVALCVTEAKGNGPRAIETALESDGDGYRLTGTKTFVTFGRYAETLIVVAKAGDKPDGRPNLVVVQIPSNRAGVELQELPKAPFVPEIPHTSMILEQVEVLRSERLAGDGYLEYVKPFRTIEDIHVVGATLGYVLGLVRRTDASPTLIGEMTAGLMALDGLRRSPPLAPAVHVALQGVYERVTALMRSDAFARLLDAVAADERERWERDKALLQVASKAREARFERAVRAIYSAASAPSRTVA